MYKNSDDVHCFLEMNNHMQTYIWPTLTPNYLGSWSIFATTYINANKCQNYSYLKE